MYKINSRYRTKHPKVSSWKIVGSEYRRWRLKESLILCCWVISIIFEYRAIHTFSFRWRMPKNSPRLLWDWLAIRFFLLFAFFRNCCCFTPIIFKILTCISIVAAPRSPELAPTLGIRPGPLR